MLRVSEVRLPLLPMHGLRDMRRRYNGHLPSQLLEPVVDFEPAAGGLVHAPHLSGPDRLHQRCQPFLVWRHRHAPRFFLRTTPHRRDRIEVDIQTDINHHVHGPAPFTKPNVHTHTSVLRKGWSSVYMMTTW